MSKKSTSRTAYWRAHKAHDRAKAKNTVIIIREELEQSPEQMAIEKLDLEPKRRNSKRSPKFCSCESLIDIKGALLCKSCRDSWRELHPPEPFSYELITLPYETGFFPPGVENSPSN